MSVGREMVDVYNLEAENKKITTTMLRSTFLPVSQVVEQEINGGKGFLNFEYRSILTILLLIFVPYAASIADNTTNKKYQI